MGASREPKEAKNVCRSPVGFGPLSVGFLKRRAAIQECYRIVSIACLRWESTSEPKEGKAQREGGETKRRTGLVFERTRSTSPLLTFGSTLSVSKSFPQMKCQINISQNRHGLQLPRNHRTMRIRDLVVFVLCEGGPFEVTLSVSKPSSQ
jgi:hypothetical protein